MGKPSPMWPASQKQIEYVLNLQADRMLPDDYKVKDVIDLERMERDEVSSLINLLKTFTRRDSGSHIKPFKMPAGRYALQGSSAESASEWRFYEVTKPTEGRWSGYTFIKRLIGAPGAYRKIDIAMHERMKLLDRIEADPKQAMVDYGLQSGVCGKCHSPLSDPVSLERGIGPICFGKLGW
jgi:hypothetical protein